MATGNASEDSLTLSLDIGTSSTRALLWDLQGREVEGVRAQSRYQMDTTPDGGVEMAADAFIRFVSECLDQALQQAGDRAARIRAVGISTYWHSLLGLDAQGRAITPIYSWADTRAGAAAQKLRQEWDQGATHERTGCMIHSSYYPAKLVWLRETQPELFARVARWASPSEYLNGVLFGADARKVSLSMASATGLFNQERCEWDRETLSALRLDADRLAPIVDLRQAVHGLTPEFAKRWPALKETPLFPAIGDGACGNIGSGCVTPRRMAVNLGTSGAIRVVWTETGDASGGSDAPARPGLPDGLWRYRVDARRPIIGAAFSDGGNVYAWMKGVLNFPEGEDLEKQIASHAPGGQDLLFLPFLAGERSLGWHPEARASIVGMNLSTTPVDILYASLEAVALRIALAADQLRELFPMAEEIVASGGALPHSPAWSQIFADAIGKPITLAEEPEASSRGAALLAMEAAGLIPDVETVGARMSRSFTPDSARHARYRELLERQQDLYRRLIDS